jgi:[calcium/calmodulin-dependent protein kinase] kinase
MTLLANANQIQQEHPWVTKNGTDPLLSFEENTSQIIEPPTEEEMNSAITRKMGHLVTVVCYHSSF